MDFSPFGVRQRWEAGYANTMRVLEQAPWLGDFDPREGVVLHEPRENAAFGGRDSIAQSELDSPFRDCKCGGKLALSITKAEEGVSYVTAT